MMSTQGRAHAALAVLCALVVMTFALPGVATGASPVKLYGLEFVLPTTTLALAPNPSYGSNGQLVPPTEVTANFKNESPPSVGASNIASIQFAVSGLVISGISCPRGTCTFDPQTNTAYVANISPPIQAAETFPVTLSVTSCVAVGDASIPLSSVLVSTGAQVDNGDLFTVYDQDSTFPLRTGLSDPTTLAATGIRCGDIDCGEHFAVANQACAVSGASCITTVRGFDTDGGCASAVDYFATNNLSTDQRDKLHFVWATDPLAAFAYRVNIPSATLPTVSLSWLSYQGSPVYITAPACTIQVPATATYDQVPLPAPYGTLATAVKANSSKILVDLAPGASPPAPNTAIVIGSERMIVTSVSNSNWSVTRGDGFTTITTHAAGAAVMFTTLPDLVADYTGAAYSFPPTSDQYLAGYRIGMKARMCLASPLLDNGDGTWSAWVVDSGDGFMSW